MDETLLARVRIVLVEPAGALNVGAVARAMKNMKLQNLVLVNPQCDRHSEEARKMAVHAADVLENARVVATLPEALNGCTRAIATTARPRTLETELEHPRKALPWLLETSAPTALIFGPEERGLSNLELNYAQRFVRIPSNPDYPSLNLAQSVAICAYELFQVTQFPSTVGDREKIYGDFDIVANTPPKSASSDQDFVAEAVTLDILEGYYQQMEAVLLKMGYLYPHTAAPRMEKLRRIFNRSGVSPTELALLRGIFSQMEWALQFMPENHR